MMNTLEKGTLLAYLNEYPLPLRSMPGHATLYLSSTLSFVNFDVTQDHKHSKSKTQLITFLPKPVFPVLVN